MAALTLPAPSSGSDQGSITVKAPSPGHSRPGRRGSSAAPSLAGACDHGELLTAVLTDDTDLAVTLGIY